MNDYIKREDAINYIGAEIVGTTQEGRELLDLCQFAIKQVPSADVVEVVRCKECKYKQYCGKAVNHTIYESTSITIECKSVDYCSYGERINSIPHDDYIESENVHLEARCLNCHNAKACKEQHWEGCVYEPTERKDNE